MPRLLTRFFGREEEIALVAESLCHASDRLVTLTGPGGSGKTRLAIAIAARLREFFQQVVAYVPLDALTEAGQILPAVARSLGLTGSPALSPLEQLSAYDHGRPWLLVLDNFEHLVDEGSLELYRLLERAPAVQCLVTSRQRLGITGEREFIVLPLPTPRAPAARLQAPGSRLQVKAGLPADGEAPVPRQSLPSLEPGAWSLERLLAYPSVQLFVDRAQAVRAEFRLTEGNAAVVAELCDRLDGLPLALELAAARSAVLSPAQMLAQMERRFQFLVTRQQDIPARHRTLLAAVEGSYQGLSPELQQFFRRLSVFRGGCSLEAAEVVCDEPEALDRLTELCECSLVVAETSAREETSVEEEVLRYRLLETLREYGWELLQASGDLKATRTRHRDWFLPIAEEAVRTPGAGKWTRLETEQENLRAALAWCQESADAEPDGDAAAAGIRLADALYGFWMHRGSIAEGLLWLRGALARGDQVPAALRASALQHASHLAHNCGDRELAASLLRSAREAQGQALAQARASGDAADLASPNALE